MNRTVNIPQLIAATIMLFSMAPLATYASDPGQWSANANNEVLDGYDVVAYQNADRAIRGDGRFKHHYQGGDFLFTTAKNRDAFAANPDKFAPAYGGFCAFAMGKAGQKVPANPKTFKMYNGKLLVFFNDLHKGKQFNTKLPWNGDEQSLHANAERNWKSN